jgi:hypothetical protein
MAIVTPAGWAQNVGAANSAQVMRLYSGGMAKGSGLLTASLSGRGGILQRAPGYNLKCLQVGAGNMTVDIEPGLCYVPGTEQVTQGGYWVGNDSTYNLGPFTTAHATQNRIDTVYVKMNDSFYSGASNTPQILIKDGTPGSGTAGSLSGINNVLKLAEVTVRAGATSILTSDINNNGRYFAAPGGVTAVRADEGSEPGTHGLELSCYQANLRYWDATALLWRPLGVSRVISTSDVGNPSTNDVAWVTSPSPAFYRYTGSTWEDWNPNLIRARLRQTVSQNIGSGLYIAVLFNVEDKDTHNGHSTVSLTARYVCQRAGSYRLNGGWSSVNTAGGAARGCAFSKNGTVISGSANVDSASTTAVHHSISAKTTTVDLAVGDYVELLAYQNQGVSIATQVASSIEQPTFEIEYVGAN